MPEQITLELIDTVCSRNDCITSLLLILLTTDLGKRYILGDFFSGFSLTLVCGFGYIDFLTFFLSVNSIEVAVKPFGALIKSL